MISLRAIIAITFGIAVGYLRGGSLSNLSKLKLKLVTPLIIGFLLHSLVWSDFFLNYKFSSQIGGYLLNLSNLLILLFLIANLKISGMSIVLLGNLSNSLVIFLNRGRMPFSLKSVKIAGLESELVKTISLPWHPGIPMSSKTILPFLGDIIPIPAPKILSGLISPGDILILLGILYLIQANMLTKEPKKTERLKTKVSSD
jgi:hypothetical protein